MAQRLDARSSFDRLLENPCGVGCEPGTPRKVTPLIDHPLRDAAISRGPDGVYYLTGTSATVTPDGTLDFENNDGIWLWKSTDLVRWDDIGQVWSISRDPLRAGFPYFGNPAMWQLSWRASRDPAVPSPVRGMTSPEIRHVQGNFHICYSMNGYGTGLLTSESGRAEGPYRDRGRITRFGGSPSMFEDDDGTVYWVWADGWIARMNSDLSGLDEPARLLGVLPDCEGGTWPLRIGTSGAFLFKADSPGLNHGQYHLVGCEEVSRMGPVLCYDTFIATAESVYGPYKRRDLMVPHGGQSTVFRGPDGRHYATVSGRDEWAALRDKPGVVPLASHPTEPRGDYWWAGAFVKPWYPVTEAGAWSEIDPLITGVSFRDASVLNAPDGYYYLTGTDMGFMKLPPRTTIGVRVWRSRDLKAWEDIGLVWKCDDSAETREGLSRLVAMSKHCPILYDIEMHYLRGTFWIVGCMQTGEHWAQNDGCLILMLRSASGRAEGPYEFHWRGRHDPHLWTPSLLEDDDGTVYIVGGGCGNNVGRLNDELTGLAGPLWEVHPRGTHLVGEGGHLLKIGRKYIHTSALWHGADPYDHAMCRNGRIFSTYDLMYFTADDLKGPWSETRCAAPKCGNARPFRDKEGQWHAPFFGNHFMGPWNQLPGLYPITVHEKDGDVLLEPVR